METERNGGSCQGHRTGIQSHATPGPWRSSAGERGKAKQKGKMSSEASVLRLRQSAQIEEAAMGRGASSASIPAHLGLGKGPGKTCPDHHAAGGALAFGLWATISALVTLCASSRFEVL